MPFQFTPKQDEAIALIAGPATHIMLEGGSRSGKTFLMCWAMALRAMMAPGSRHCILRYRFNHVIQSVWYGTFPQMMALCFPGVKYTENKAHWFIEFPGGSQIWFGGLDDKERTEKILGNEYVTMGLNEASQISYQAREIARTRLAQKVLKQDGQPMRLKMLYDQNPPGKGWWTYKVWHKGLDPDTGQLLKNPNDYAFIKLNPADNRENIAAEYIKGLENSSARIRQRFLLGEYADENPNALFSDATVEKWRVLDGRVPEMVRIIVACDPSGAGDSDNADNDAIGVVAVGLGTDGNAYVMEDNTVKAGPATWGGVVVDTYDRLKANLVVGEKNYGGAMVEFTIQAAAKGKQMRPVPFKYTVSSRGKHLRADPVAVLYEQGKVRHCGYFPELEEELAAFSTNGYTGGGSPNRADALVFAITELFPGLVRREEETKSRGMMPVRSGYTSTLGFAR